MCPQKNICRKVIGVKIDGQFDTDKIWMSNCISKTLNINRCNPLWKEKFIELSDIVFW